jgi:hypothetical protein
MTFKEALQRLNIEDYGERIFNSNSHGELFHLQEYITIAEAFDDTTWFRDWFIEIVEYAEKNWKRPESIFQHIIRALKESVKDDEEQ